MAKRKTTKKRAAAPRRRRTMSAAAPRRRVRRRSTTRKKKGFLSAVSTESKATMKTMVSGAVGGFGYLLFEDQVVDGSTTPWTPEKKGLVALGLSYGLSVFLGKPQIAAGLTGAAAYDFFKVKGLLGDESEQMRRQQYADPLQNVPVMLSDDEMYLAQGGNAGQMYLQDANGNMYLQDGNGNYLPAYANTTTY